MVVDYTEKPYFIGHTPLDSQVGEKDALVEKKETIGFDQALVQLEAPEADPYGSDEVSSEGSKELGARWMIVREISKGRSPAGTEGSTRREERSM
eukprot:jgi/Psemu1/61948/gm1.61948_g